VLLGVPLLASNLLEPLLYLAADAGHRRLLVLSGGVFYALALAAFAVAPGFAVVLAAFLTLCPASGAFVTLSQGTLMDLEPADRERNMARWALTGSLAVLIAPLALAALLAAGGGWRLALFALAACALALVPPVARVPLDGERRPFVLRGALAELRRREVRRWLLVLEAANLIFEGLGGFLALYFTDAVGSSPARASIAVAVWAGGALAGDALVLAALRLMPGVRWLRLTAVGFLIVLPIFLLAPGYEAKLPLLALAGGVSSCWYALPKARLYAELPDRTGAALALANVAGLLGTPTPFLLGALAGAVGLGLTFWLFLVAPLLLLALVPRTTPT
jgi:FSR family fosmidomycin resistance protein-like MFS transporter